MKTSSDSMQRGERTKRIVVGALALLTLGSVGTTLWYANANGELSQNVDSGRLNNERLLAEKLQLEKQVTGLGIRFEKEREALNTSESTVSDLRRKVQEALNRANVSENAVRKSRDLQKEVADLRLLKQQLEVHLMAATSNERDLRAELERMTQERDAMAARFEEYKVSAQMVNNAEVDALRGKKGRLTVIARRAREIRMAFDLPQNIAQGASFKIIAPDGKNYQGADPAISMTIDEVDPEPMASIDMMPEVPVGDRAARVHLKFAPTEKLKPGTYRIDVMADGEYMNTVLLNLR